MKTKDISLKEFIENSITSIFDATIELQKKYGGERVGGIVSPSTETSKSKECKVNNSHRVITPIHFELDVEASRGFNVEAGVTITVVTAQIGGGFRKSTSKAQHLSFDIDVALPSIRTDGKYRPMPDIQG